MFKLIKGPILMAGTSLLITQVCLANDVTDTQQLQAALSQNVAQHNGIAPEVSKQTPLIQAEDTHTSTQVAVVIQEEVSAGDAVYPLGLTKEQYIERLKQLEKRRQLPIDEQPNKDKKIQLQQLDELLERLKHQKMADKKTQVEEVGLIPERGEEVSPVAEQAVTEVIEETSLLSRFLNR